MNLLSRLGLPVIILVTCWAFGQDLVKREYLVKVDTSSFDPYSGATNICLLVWDDGRYRLEKTQQGASGGKPEVKVFLDSLSENSMKQLQNILNDSQFAAVKRQHDEAAAIVQDLEPLQVVIPREHGLQQFYFVNAEDRKPFEKTLKPFMNWMKDVQKRKVMVAKGEKPNRCATPMVQYRYQGSMPQAEQDQQ